MIQLMKHDSKYTEIMSQMTSDPHVKESLNLSWQQCSLNGTRDFIEFILGEERQSLQLSRVIINEKQELVGVITLKAIDRANKTAHIGTWIGYPYWGKGYNEAAKIEILKIAFLELQLEYVFAGATMQNKRSIAAQKKLPYMSLDVGREFPTELKLIEKETGNPCILNVVRQADFLTFLESQSR